MSPRYLPTPRGGLDCFQALKASLLSGLSAAKGFLSFLELLSVSKSFVQEQSAWTPRARQGLVQAPCRRASQPAGQEPRATLQVCSRSAGHTRLLICTGPGEGERELCLSGQPAACSDSGCRRAGGGAARLEEVNWIGQENVPFVYTPSSAHVSVSGWGRSGCSTRGPAGKAAAVLKASVYIGGGLARIGVARASGVWSPPWFSPFAACRVNSKPTCSSPRGGVSHI